jgi:hypothetical protein
VEWRSPTHARKNLATKETKFLPVFFWFVSFVLGFFSWGAALIFFRSTRLKSKIMKRYKNLLLVALVLGLAMLSCRPENVGPRDFGGRAIAGAAGEEHRILDTICKYSSVIPFRSNDGSYRINKCYAAFSVDSFPVPVPCRPGEVQPYWGSMQMFNGYTVYQGDTSHFLEVSFALEYGWYCDIRNWLFQVSNGIVIDPNTGFPGSQNGDWQFLDYFEMPGEWKIQVPVDSLFKPCFDLAVKLSVAAADINGAPIEDYRTELWAVNPNYNVPGSGEESNSPYAIHFCPFACLDKTYITENKCRNVFTGLSCTNTLGSAVLTANDTTQSGLLANNPIYNWSNGMHTKTITVSPTVTSTYTVTVLEGTTVKRITTYTVNAVNVGCNVPDHRADFCPSFLDIRYGQSFNIRNYVRMKDNTPVNWAEVAFTYTTVGANAPTVPANWNLAAFNAGTSVTVTSADAVTGSGNVGRGEYRVYVHRVGQTTYDDFMTIRVHPTRTSNVSTAVCSTGACGYIPGVRICNVPPGQPQNATSLCVPYAGLAPFNIQGLCGSTGGPTSNYLGLCGQAPCNN